MSMKNAMPNLQQDMKGQKLSVMTSQRRLKAKDDITFDFKNGFEVRV